MVHGKFGLTLYLYLVINPKKVNAGDEPFHVCAFLPEEYVMVEDVLPAVYHFYNVEHVPSDTVEHVPSDTDEDPEE